MDGKKSVLVGATAAVVGLWWLHRSRSRGAKSEGRGPEIDTATAAAGLLSKLRTPSFHSVEVEVADGLVLKVGADTTAETACDSLLLIAEKKSNSNCSVRYEVSLPRFVEAEYIAGVIAGVTAAEVARGPDDIRACAGATNFILGEWALGSMRCSQVKSHHQWHPATCGGHALFNVECLLDGRACATGDAARDEMEVWRFHAVAYQTLTREGVKCGRWTQKSLRTGIFDHAHMEFLVDASPSLRGKPITTQPSGLTTTPSIHRAGDGHPYADSEGGLHTIIN